MKRAMLTILAMTSAIAGTMLAMIEHQTTLLPDRIASILAVGCFMFSGMCWMLFGSSYRDRPDKSTDPKATQLP